MVSSEHQGELMTEPLSGTAIRQELVTAIQQVRKRWRTKLLLRGGIVVLGGFLLALLVASWGLQAYKFSPASVIGFRIAIFTVFFALVGFFFLRPLRQRVTDLQVALFVEESEPKLQAAILAAVDAGGLGEGTGGALSADVHPVILERMIQQAIEK